MKFVKKPIIIEAEQWWPGKNIDGVESMTLPEGREIHVISTLEGRMEVTPGDWIITGVAQEKYPCKDSIFQQTYDPVLSEQVNLRESRSYPSFIRKQL